MRVRETRDRSRLIAAAMQKIPCDLTVENTRFVNVLTGEIYPASVDVLDGIVVRVREEGKETAVPSRTVYDAKGRYLVPGFIDVHMHVESTMMTPANFGRAAILCGTTSVFVDPHEIGNVLGIEGVRFMVEDARRSPVRQFNLAPSCVPSVPGTEGSGAEFNAEEIAQLLGMDGVYGIAEVMDFYHVIHDSDKMHNVVEEGVRRGVLIQGHAPGILDQELAAYRLAGPSDNHCISGPEDTLQNLRNGMYVDFQESSMLPRRMHRLVEGLKTVRYTDHVTLCNDDVHAKDLLETGHINRLTKSAMAEGIDPVEAIRWVTYNASRNTGIEDLGAIAPGYVADMQLLDELDGRNPYAVFSEGKLLAEGGKLVEEPEETGQKAETGNTVKLDWITGPSDFQIRTPGVQEGSVRIAVLDYGAEGSRCEVVYEEVPVKKGAVDIRSCEGLHYVGVWNRHGKQDHTVALCRNYGLQEGVIASTVAHDCHNLIMMYYEPEEAFLAAETLKQCGGGVCAVQAGKVTGLLPLPVAGIMSNLSCEELVPAIARAEEAAAKICPDKKLMEIAVIPLACMPSAVITDRGILDGRTQTFYPMFEK